MQSLLRWSIENSTPSSGDNTTSPPVRPRSDLDPAIIDQILGRPDAELMKEALQVALDEKQDLDDRVQALDNFEMVSRLPELVWVCERCAYLTLFFG